MSDNNAFIPMISFGIMPVLAVGSRFMKKKRNTLKPLLEKLRGVTPEKIQEARKIVSVAEFKAPERVLQPKPIETPREAKKTPEKAFKEVLEVKPEPVQEIVRVQEQIQVQDIDFER